MESLQFRDWRLNKDFDIRRLENWIKSKPNCQGTGFYNEVPFQGEESDADKYEDNLRQNELSNVY